MQNQRFFRWTGILAAVLLLGASCSENLLYEEQHPVPEDNVSHGEDGPETSLDGKFVISYSMDSEGRTSRGSDTQANRHIRSLDYYVYLPSGTLYKHRHIRGIDSSTRWPISDRNQMSWELRQDLQDTLPEGYDYRILFIANTSPALFEKVEDPQGGAPMEQKIIINEQDYSTARILLPREPLTDNTMFYMWEGEILRTAPDIVPETSVKRNDIVLRRIVARNDFVRAIEPSTPALPNTDAHLYKAVREGFYKDYKSKVDAAVEAQIEAFCKVVYEQVIQYTAQDGYPFYGEDGEAAKLNAFLRRHKTDIAAEVERRILTDYVSKVKGDNQSGQLWRQAEAWEGRDVEVVFTADPSMAQANALGFDRTAYHLPEVTSCHRYKAGTDGRFSITGFSGGQFNHLVGLKFTDREGISAPFEVQDTDFHFTDRQELNTWRDIVCNPIAAITLRPEAAGNNDVKITIDMRTLLGSMEVEPQMTFDQLLEVTGEKTNIPNKGSYSVHGYMEWYVFHIDHHSNKQRSFGNSFSEFEFPLTLPDLTESKKLKIDQMIRVIPSWKITLHK